MMRCDAGLHADEAARELFEERQNVLASQLPGENNFLVRVNTMNVEYILRYIDADCLNLHGNASCGWIAPRPSPYVSKALDAGVVHGIKTINPHPEHSASVSEQAAEQLAFQHWPLHIPTHHPAAFCFA